VLLLAGLPGISPDALYIPSIFCYFAKIRQNTLFSGKGIQWPSMARSPLPWTKVCAKRKSGHVLGVRFWLFIGLLLAIRAYIEHFIETGKSGRFTGVSGRWFGETGTDSGLDWGYQRYSGIGKKARNS
jgi:hypothetical protein